MFKSDSLRRVCLIGSPEWQSLAKAVLDPYFEVSSHHQSLDHPPELYLIEHDHPRLAVESVLRRLGYAPIKTCSLRELSTIREARKNPVYYFNLSSTVPPHRGISSAPMAQHTEDLPPALARLIGESPAMIALKRRLVRYARSDKPVLLLGETGVGKDVVARLIHESSPVHAGPFVVQNCAALPAGLAESEFLGSTRGAFTGATDKAGLFQLADGGTLFLDEIGDLDPGIQTKLLRCLDSGEYRPLGSSKLRFSRFRLIAATNKDPAVLLEKGLFREDFYFRIQTLTLRIPPLRERGDDLALLVNTLYPGIRLTPRAWRALYDNPWRGNVRELKAVIERALIEADGEVIDCGHLRD